MEGNIKEAYVIDSSYIASYLLPDETNQIVTDLFDEFYENRVKLYAPPLLFYEIVNILRSAVIQKRITKKQAQKHLEDFRDLDIAIEASDFQMILTIAFEQNISAYDASYLQLSIEQKIPLLSLDKKLTKIANL